MLSGVLIYFRVPLIIAVFLCPLVLLAADTLDVGLTENGTIIEAAALPARSTALPTVLLVGGLAGADESVGIVRQELKTFEGTKLDRRRFRLVFAWRSRS